MRRSYFLGLLLAGCSGAAQVPPTPPVSEVVPDSTPTPARGPEIPVAERTELAGGDLVYQRIARSVERMGVLDGGLMWAGGDGTTFSVFDSAGRVRITRRFFAGNRQLSVTSAAHGYVFIAAAAGMVGMRNRPGGLQSWDLASDRLTSLGDIAPNGAAISSSANGTRLGVYRNEADAFEFLVYSVDPPSGRVRALAQRAAPSRPVRLRMAPSGERLMVPAESGSADAGALMWHEASGWQDTELPDVYAFDPRGRAWIVRDGRGLDFRHPGSGESLLRVLLDFEPTRLQYSYDGSTLLVLDENGGAALLNAETGARLSLPEEAPSLYRDSVWPVEGGVLYPQGDRIVYFADGVSTHSAVEAHLGSPPTDTAVLVRLPTYELSLRALPSLEEIRVMPLGGESSLWDIYFSADSATLVTTGRRGTEAWGHTGIAARHCAGPTATLASANAAGSPRILMNGQICDLQTGSRTGDNITHISEDGRRYVTSDQNERQTLHEGETGSTVRNLPAGCRPGLSCYRYVDLSDDGSHYTTAATRATRIRVWNERGRRVGELRDVEGTERTALSAAGGFVAVWLPEELKIFRARGSVVHTRMRDETSYPVVAFSRDETRVAVASGTTVEVLRLPSGDVFQTHELEEGIVGLRFDASGSLQASTALRAASFGPDGSVQVPLVDGDELLEPSISPEGDRYASCTGGTLTMHDALTRQAETLGECSPGDRAVFSPNGELLALVRGSEVRIHRLGTPHWLRLRVYGARDGAIPVAVDEQGRYEINPAHSNALEEFLYRRAGDARTAELVSTDEVPPTPGLVAAFFSPPE